MCQQQKLAAERVSPSPMAVKLAKITVVLIFFCFAECAAGSCLQYGHSCWGAHGKRNDPSNIASEEIPANDAPTDTRWFLSRLYQGPSDLRQWRAKDGIVVPLFEHNHNIEHQMLRENEVGEGPKTAQEDEVIDYQDPSLSVLDGVYGDEPRVRNWQERVRLYNFLKFHKPSTA